MNQIRVRFAPAPTGYLHIGGARTALFTWLFARKNNGTFILRIDDTDEARSTEESLRGILDSLRWLGLDWDEGPEIGGPHGPYFQSERMGIYKEYIQKLLNSGNAYYCYCTKEEIDAEKAKVGPWDYRYSGKCRQLIEADKRRYEAEGRKPTVRLKIAGDTIVVPDLIKGYVEFKAETLDDFIIVRSNGTPLYNFTSTVDDSLMRITHVIRGEDHLTNTPKQILIYQALGFETPKFAHAPTVLDTEGRKLSKRRHGELVSIGFYRDNGYLPEAMVNFLARLGWSYNDKEEMFTVDELLDKFDLGRVGKSASTFDIQKLQWLNREYIMKRDIHERTDLVIPFLQKAGLLSDKPLTADRRTWLEKLVEVIGDRMTTLADIENSSFFFVDEIEYDPKAVKKSLKRGFVSGMLRDLKSIFTELEPFDENNIEAKIREYAGQSGLGGKVMLPIRVAVTGKSTGPGLFESLALLGRDKVLQRIDKAMTLL
ncbi:MAG: glutamate--tRNA ligase [Candidatus Poribacteria bacterium]